MNVSLTPELESWVKEKVDTGLYTSASEVIREAIRTLRQQDELQILQRGQLLQELHKGIVQLDSGQSQLLTQELIEHIKANARKSQGM